MEQKCDTRLLVTLNGGARPSILKGSETARDLTQKRVRFFKRYPSMPKVKKPGMKVVKTRSCAGGDAAQASSSKGQEGHKRKERDGGETAPGGGVDGTGQNKRPKKDDKRGEDEGSKSSHPDSGKAEVPMKEVSYWVKMVLGGDADIPVQEITRIPESCTNVARLLKYLRKDCEETKGDLEGINPASRLILCAPTEEENKVLEKHPRKLPNRLGTNGDLETNSLDPTATLDSAYMLQYNANSSSSDDPESRKYLLVVDTSPGKPLHSPQKSQSHSGSDTLESLVNDDASSFAEWAGQLSGDDLKGNEAVSFPIAFDMNNGVLYGTEIFIRECYSGLYDVMKKGKNAFNYIVGTPGIGKSYMRNYVAARVIAEAEGDALVLFSKGGFNNGGQRIYMMGRVDGQAVGYSASKTSDIDDIVEHARRIAQKQDSTVHNLCDVSLGEVAAPKDSNIVLSYFSSPHPGIVKAYREAKKASKEQAVMLVMNLWSAAEVTAAVSKLGVRPVHSVDELMAKFGGVARPMLEGESMWAEQLSRITSGAESLGNDHLAKVFLDTAAGSEFSDVQQFSHSLVYLTLADSSPNDFVYEPGSKKKNVRLTFGSPYIRSCVAKELVKRAKNHYDDILGLRNRSVRGFEFEDFALAYLLCHKDGAQSIVVEHVADRLSCDLSNATNGQQTRQSATDEEVNNVANRIEKRRLLFESSSLVPSTCYSNRTAWYEDIKTKENARNVLQRAIDHVTHQSGRADGVLVWPLAWNQEAIDGIWVYCVNGEVCVALLQVTLNDTHSINSQYVNDLVAAFSDVRMGLVFLVGSVELYEKYKNSTSTNVTLTGCGLILPQYAGCVLASGKFSML